MLILCVVSLISNAQIINVNEINNHSQNETTIYCDIESRQFFFDWSQRYHNVNILRTSRDIFVKKRDENIRVHPNFS